MLYQRALAKACKVNAASLGVKTPSSEKTHNDLLSREEDALYGAGDDDGAFPLRRRGGAGGVRVREVDGRARLLHDLLDVRAVAADHEQVVLRGDLQLHAHGHRGLIKDAELSIRNSRKSWKSLQAQFTQGLTRKCKQPSVVNRIVHTGCKQHQKNCPQICVLASSVDWALSD